MLADMRVRNALIALAYGLSLSINSIAETVYHLDIPPGDLTSALELLSHQTRVELIYSAEDLKGIHTNGVHGDVSAETGLKRLLEGTGLVVRTHPSGAILVTRDQRSTVESRAQPSPYVRDRL